jgi:hypothetical protein
MIGILKYINIFEVMYFGVLSYFLVKSIPDQPKKTSYHNSCMLLWHNIDIKYVERYDYIDGLGKNGKYVKYIFEIIWSLSKIKLECRCLVRKFL